MTNQSLLLSLGEACSPLQTVATESEMAEVVIWWKGMESGEEKRDLQVLVVLWLESALVAATTEGIWENEEGERKFNWSFPTHILKKDNLNFLEINNFFSNVQLQVVSNVGCTPPWVCSRRSISMQEENIRTSATHVSYK